MSAGQQGKMNNAQLLHLAILAIVIIALARKMPSFALNRPVTLAMILSAITLFGVAALIQSPVELMPNVSYGNVTLFIDVRGTMPPPEVERLVTKPVEEAIGAASHLRNLISSSNNDLALLS